MIPLSVTIIYELFIMNTNGRYSSGSIKNTLSNALSENISAIDTIIYKSYLNIITLDIDPLPAIGILADIAINPFGPTQIVALLLLVTNEPLFTSRLDRGDNTFHANDSPGAAKRAHFTG